MAARCGGAWGGDGPRWSLVACSPASLGEMASSGFCERPVSEEEKGEEEEDLEE